MHFHFKRKLNVSVLFSYLGLSETGICGEFRFLCYLILGTQSAWLYRAAGGPPSARHCLIQVREIKDTLILIYVSI